MPLPPNSSALFVDWLGQNELLLNFWPYVLGVAVIYLLSRFYTGPVRWLAWGSLRLLMAFAGILLINALISPFGFHLGVNPWNVLIVAALGLPGFGLLFFAQYFFAV